MRSLSVILKLCDSGRLSAILQGKGYVQLKNHRGLRNHFINRGCAQLEFEQAGFEVLEVAGSVYPQKRWSLTTPWYYYVLQKLQNQGTKRNTRVGSA